VDDRPDEELIKAIRGGETKAYEVLVRRHTARIFALCLGILGNVSDSEDVAQETLVKALNKIQTLQDRSQFSGWISQIARNLCLDLLRSRKRHRELLNQNRDMIHPKTGDYSKLREALEELPEEHRLPLMLFYFDGQNTENLARALNLSRSGACTRLSRARKALRRKLTSENHGE
jgi:RNA polymerase sigma-70 factor (ECF subfamily)